MTQHAADVVEQALRAVEGGFTPAQIKAAIKSMTEPQLARMAWRTKWCSTRHEHQIPPEGVRRGTWLLLGGRGSGKSRVGAEEIGFAAAMASRGDRSLVSGPTFSDVSKVCFEGDSGLLAVIPECLIKKYVRSLGELYLHNGAYIGGIPASESGRFRGPQWHRAWCDEVAAWADNGGNDEEAWDLMAMSVRLGNATFKIATTTPKPTRLIYRFMEEHKANPDRVHITTATTYDNIEHLSDDFKAEILKYEGTQLGLQEIYAQVLNPESTGIIKRDWIQKWPNGKPMPAFDLIVKSVDTAYSDKHVDKNKRTDPSAASVWGAFKMEVMRGDKRVMVPGIMLLDAWQDHLNFPDLVKRLKDENKHRYGGEEFRPLVRAPGAPKAGDMVGKMVDYMVIEEKASGKSVRQQLAAEGIVTRGWNPGKADKLSRLHLISPLFSRGYVWIPESKVKGRFNTNLEPLVQQVCGYSGKDSIIHDDLLDTTTQALRFINDQWLQFLHFGDTKSRRQPQVTRTQSRVNPYGI